LTTEEYKGDPELKGFLDEVAVNNEVLAAVSNSALITPDEEFGMLRLWIDGCKSASQVSVIYIPSKPFLVSFGTVYYITVDGIKKQINE